ncbi:MAG TPA: FAD-binding oxidoreductase [Myxococcota bacterium]|nr:FAD-binding oxidoreductase [Myxococcota bacterium]HRY96419.1 FAD-binding oxidoreductase [Myxococcota bacterium]HSA21772.1 FAD-binding oxidoreductase [Myxococcota bacterium]
MPAPATVFPELPASLLSALRAKLGEEHVSTREEDLLACSRDMWPRSLIRQRAGAIEHPPAAVVWPGDEAQVAEVVRLAGAHGAPVVPFGAGSGVCGGTLPVRGGLILDLKRLDRILALDERDRLLEVEVGVMGEVLERELVRRGFSLGHFPSSILCSTVGGWLAGRSAGQCSSRFGKIEDIVRSLRWVDAAGRVRETCLRPCGVSPGSLDALLLGSEGTLGVLTSARLAVWPLARERWLRAFRFPDVDAGLRAMAGMLRAGLRPSVLRLYDEFDTLLARSGKDDAGDPRESLSASLPALALPARALLARSLPMVLRAPRLLNRVTGLLPTGCLLVVIVEGGLAGGQAWRLAAERIPALCVREGASDAGEGPALHWWKNRYAISYKQSGLFSAGAFVDTMEVAATWDRLPRLYRAVRKALEPLAFVMAHFSHAYREGGSIYFTFAGAAEDDAGAAVLYDRIWDAAQAVVLSAGATVSHHHGVGFSKARYLVRQLGPAQALAEHLKASLDPAGSMNPGKLGLGGGGAGEAHHGQAR